MQLEHQYTFWWLQVVPIERSRSFTEGDRYNSIKTMIQKFNSWHPSCARTSCSLAFRCRSLTSCLGSFNTGPHLLFLSCSACFSAYSRAFRATRSFSWELLSYPFMCNSTSPICIQYTSLLRWLSIPLLSIGARKFRCFRLWKVLLHYSTHMSLS